MALWVESQDKQLATLIPQYRQQPLRNLEDDFSSQAVIASSTELFHFYRLALTQCAKLSGGARLLDLSKTFAKYLDQYSQHVLLYFLTEKFGTTGPSLEDMVVILNTADYCFLTCNQLEEKIKSKTDEELQPEVDLQNQADSFMGVASTTIRALVKRVELELDHVLKEMRNFPWAKLETVVDQSSYVPEMLRIIRTSAQEILEYLHKPQYARAFQDQLVDAISIAYCVNVFQCKPVSTTGAEQMLLDSYALKKGLLDLPALTADTSTAMNEANINRFAQRAKNSLSRIESLLKTLQVRSSPPEVLVQAYLIHLQDRSEVHFRRILELKGVRKSDLVSLVELFKAHAASPTHASLPAASPFLTNLFALQAPTASQKNDKIDKDSNALKEAAQLGTALMNAAREGVDRLGSPISQSAGEALASLNVSPGLPDLGAGGASNLNENLKNFGKFFRRDGGFGRFGRTNTAPTG
jgi:hypothetical protein